MNGMVMIRKQCVKVLHFVNKHFFIRHIIHAKLLLKENK